jgi:DNA-binding IclR family transcriptional regulator
VTSPVSWESPSPPHPNLLLALEEARLISRQGAEFTLGRKLVELGAAYLSRLDEVQEFYRYLRTGAHAFG